MSAVVNNPAPSSTPQSGTDYSAVKNPYATQHLKRTYGDYLLKFLTMGAVPTPWEKAESQRLANYDAWESQHSEQQRQELYNSAQEQVERERDAGINPDLAGDVSAGESAEGLMDNYPFKSSYDAFNDANKQFSDIVMTGLQFGMGALQSIFNIKELKTAIDSRELDASAKILGLSEEAIKKFTDTQPGYRSIIEDYKGDLPKWVEDNFGPMMYGLPKRYRKRFRDSVTYMLESDFGKKLRADTITEAGDSIVNAFGRQPVVEGTGWDVETGLLQPMTDITERISKTQIDAYDKYNTKITELQTKVDEKKLTTEQAELEAQEYLADIRRTMFDSLKDVFNYVHERYTDGNIFQKIMSGGFLTAMGATAAGLIPNISFGTSNSSNSSFKAGQNAQSSGSSSSKSFSFGW